MPHLYRAALEHAGLVARSRRRAAVRRGGDRWRVPRDAGQRELDRSDALLAYWPLLEDIERVPGELPAAHDALAVSTP